MHDQSLHGSTVDQEEGELCERQLECHLGRKESSLSDAEP